jgi:hypothetical protein
VISGTENVDSKINKVLDEMGGKKLPQHRKHANQVGHARWSCLITTTGSQESEQDHVE